MGVDEGPGPRGEIENTVTAEVDYLKAMGVPEADWQYLRRTGLPKSITLPFALEYTTYPLIGHGDAHYLFEKRNSLMLLGEMDGPSYAAIRPDGVIVLSTDYDASELFVNSSVRQFGECLSLYSSFMDDNRTYEWLRSAIADVDPIAMSNDEYYWPIAIADLEGMDN
jgi:hypothetical protein